MGACASALCSRAADAGSGTLAYSQADGLWVRHLPDGAPRKIAAAAKNPRFSPSGEWVAFEGGVVRTDGAASAPLPPGARVWLPHQDTLAIDTDRGLAFFSARNNWRAPTALRAGVGSPIFNSDGSAFVYSGAVTVGTGAGGEPMRNGQLCRTSLAGPDSQILVSQYLVSPLPYAWTRDFILYWEDPDFSASVAADGLELFRVPATGGHSESLGVGTLLHQDLLALSPTRHQLAATVGSGRQVYEANRIAVVDLDTLALRYLTGPNLSAMAPSWSPDGGRVAYVQAPAVGPADDDNLSALPYMRQRRIWVADADGAMPPHSLTSDARYRDEEPLWSADGTRILFGRLDASGAATLWLMGAGGENPVPVSGPLPLKNAAIGFYGYLDWRAAFDWRK